jgi:aspartate kinase
VFACLKETPIRLISLGSSDTNLSIVVPQDRTEEAVGRLHKEFFEPQVVRASNS